MHDPAIRAEGLGKRFRIGRRASYRTLRESLVEAARAPLRALRGGARDPEADTLWALRDVSFDVGRGEAVGIIGSNGAGKSTLLKLLARITEPTAGRATIRGRVGSLLEVGTGFHPELTGRENVFLNGAILGMRRAEIQRRFDAIVAFAGVERFLDTPVKRYSSGMRMRLAFAVAAHLDPEILVIDEVLAVGDAAFQRQCLGVMSDVARTGRTVLFVSHNLKAVRRLCPRSLWLAGGRIERDGPTDEVIAAYLEGTRQTRPLDEMGEAIAALPPDPDFALRHVAVRQGGQPASVLRNGEPTEIEIHYEVREATRGLRVYVDLLDEDQDLLVRSFQDDDADAVPVTEPGRYVALATLPATFLAPRPYTLIVRASIFNVRALTGPGIALRLDVEPTSRLNRAYPSDPVRAKLQPALAWETKRTEPEP